MTLVDSIILGIVQGLAEFRPVSSSGHLVIVSRLLKLAPNVPFDIALHFATLLAVCAFFARDIFEIIKAFLIDRRLDNPHFKLGLLIIVASVPTAIIGFSLSDVFEAMFGSPVAVGFFLIVTAALIMAAETYGKARKDIQKVSFLDALMIGLMQGCAIAPGLSRSGATISASLLAGMERKLALRFSFLLSIPAILGASIFKAGAIYHNVNLQMIAGAAAAAISGYFAIWLFVRMVEKKNMKVFAYYCLIAGLFAVMLGMAG
ncbi:MAG: undecaprenyl-diphosphate phosphatase [bacterium]